MRGASLTAQRAWVVGQLAEVALHMFGVWLRVMLQKFCVPLVNFHTVLLYVLGVSSHEQVTTDLEEQKLSHMRREWPVVSQKEGMHLSFC